MLSKGLVFAIRVYQRCVSPYLPSVCRFVPTCSEYAAEAISRRGALVGSWLSLRRLARCWPFVKGGFDPVPEGRAEENGQRRVTGEGNAG